LFGGPLWDRYGAIVIPPAAITYVFATMMTSLCETYWQFMLAQGLLGGIALGMTLSPANASTPQYFLKKRGTAMGCAIAGSSIGGVVFPIALNRMLENTNLGFGWSVRVCGFILLAVLIPSCMAIKPRLPPRQSKFFLPSAFKEVPYVVLTLALSCVFLGIFPPIFLIPDFAITQGMSNTLSFYLLAILNAASFPGRILPGILSDKIGKLNMLVLAALSTGIVLLCWPAVSGNAGIFVFTAIFGFTSGAIFSAGTVAFASVPKDPRNIGTYIGMGMGCVSIAALIGPPANGALVARYGGFVQVAIMSGIFCLAGGLLVLVAKQTSGKGLLAKA
jgi:MFS family permease